MPEDKEMIIKVAEVGEALRYLERRADQQDSEIQNLHRENAKQSEEIRDAAYLADSIRNSYEEFRTACSEHRGCQYDIAEKLREELETLKVNDIDSLREAIRKATTNKLVLIIQTATTTLIVASAVIGTLLGWFKFGG